MALPSPSFPCPGERDGFRGLEVAPAARPSPQEERERVPDYEALVIVDAGLEEGDIQKAVDRFLAVVTEAGGEVASVDRWGVRRFAYEIDHKNEGYYFVTNFRAPQDTVPRLNQVLRIGDEYVRGKVLRPQ
jgi:small subunit ribosomal protein S6